MTGLGQRGRARRGSVQLSSDKARALGSVQTGQDKTGAERSVRRTFSSGRTGTHSPRLKSGRARQDSPQLRPERSARPSSAQTPGRSARPRPQGAWPGPAQTAGRSARLSLNRSARPGSDRIRPECGSGAGSQAGGGG